MEGAPPHDCVDDEFEGCSTDGDQGSIEAYDCCYDREFLHRIGSRISATADRKIDPEERGSERLKKLQWEDIIEFFRRHSGKNSGKIELVKKSNFVST